MTMDNKTKYGADCSLIGKLPPQNVEAEKAVLGAMLLDNSIIDAIAERLESTDYYDGRNGIIHTAIMNLHNTSQTADILTVAEELKRMQKLEEVGGPLYVNGLSAYIGSIKTAEQYARIVRTKSKARQIIRACAETIDRAYSQEEDEEGLRNYAESKVYDAIREDSAQEYCYIGEVAKNVLRKIIENRKKGRQITGLATGYPQFDKAISGLQRGKLYVLAARPGMGKTALALNIARNVSMGSPKAHVVIFSLEMNKEELTNRLLCCLAKIDSHRLDSGELNKAEWANLAAATKQLLTTPIIIDDTPEPALSHIRTISRRLKSKKELDLVIVDYLQLTGQENTKTITREQEVAKVSRGLKILARELDIPILEISSLSRAVDVRADHKPMLSDLRESGSIEQDADAVFFLFAESYYNPESFVETEETKGDAPTDLIIAKNRSGPKMTIHLYFRGRYTEFTEATTVGQAN